ncbi:MAG TPA: sucrose-phosphate phosphatase [Nostocaceae cyanobacterium]|nr:sucrose-phosphate phosphatase [Nostocaceae cyanobacterium]
MRAFLFVTDLDYTLVGDKESLEHLKQKLVHHREEYGTKIVYATGRSLTLFKQLQQEENLLEPDALITSVGTEIYINSNYKTPDLEWSEKLSVGWNRELVKEIASKFKELKPQRESEQRPFKVSYLIKEEFAQKIIPQLNNLLKNENIKFNLIYSGSEDLDILPLHADKGLAVKFLQNKWGYDAHKTVVCGDSGNDIAMFSLEKARGIIVGNARSELREWYEANKTEYHYFASSSYSKGILEGLQYFEFIK